ncbi:MAG TPA: riboflavin biosynthesis protein RibF [Phycisphaerales bacterium]|nr:riboflavin biosynthesis protein RibF [Phycisphaerales bacterium]
MMREPACVLMIGNFDGCHLGHRALIGRARAIADDARLRVLAMSFDPHPAEALGQTPPPRLTMWNRRVSILHSLGVDEVIRLEPTHGLLGLDPEQFIESRIAPLHVRHIVEGHDFRFGRNRAGDLGVLRALGEGFGFAVHEIGPVPGVLMDHAEVLVSSTLIRWLIEQGRVRDAARLLGRPHIVEGTVERGDRLGRTIGFPTANMQCHTMPPGDGVYAGWAELPDGSRHPAAISMGSRPTVNGKEDRFETFIIDAERSGACIAGLPEYGWTLAVHLIARIRDQARFGSVDMLKDQLARDCRRARTLLEQRQPAGANA